MSRSSEQRETTSKRQFNVTTCDACGKEHATEAYQAPYQFPGGIIGGGMITSTLTSCDHLGGMPSGWYRLYGGKIPEDFCSLSCVESRAKA